MGKLRHCSPQSRAVVLKSIVIEVPVSEKKPFPTRAMPLFEVKIMFGAFDREMII